MVNSPLIRPYVLGAGSFGGGGTLGSHDGTWKKCQKILQKEVILSGEQLLMEDIRLTS